MRLMEFVAFKWRPRIQDGRARYQFTADSVNVLKSMIDAHYAAPHRLTCVTDEPAGIHPDVRIVPLWPDYADVISPHGERNPSCYRRLKLFSPDAAEIIGPRFVALDLDCVITGDLAPLVDRPEDFVMWGDTNPRPGSHYNGSFLLLTAGARRQVWDRFDPATSPRTSLRAGCYGSDQGWISYCLGPGETKLSKADGVYSFRNDLKRDPNLPRDARLVFFHGELKPWSPEVQRTHAWVRKYWVDRQREAVAS